jgi:hypothetical protein
MAVDMLAEPGFHPRRWYLALAAIAGGVHLTILVSLGVLEIATLDHTDPGRYGLAAVLHQLQRTLSSPVFLFFRPGWTLWLRPYVGDDRWMIGFLVALNSLAWGAALAGATWWWQRSGVQQRLLGSAALIGAICLAVVLTITGVIYCHGDFSGFLHCHSLFTPDHDH